MDEHPLVRFVDGPAGRRARLVGTGKDVWEVVSVVRDNDGDVRAASDYLELPLGLARAGLAASVKLLLDEMFSPAIARELQSRGYDVESVSGRSDWQALSDAEVMEVARRERRAIVTDNLRDFRPLHHEAILPGGPGHFGMVFAGGSYPRTEADVGKIVTALGRKLDEYPPDRDLAGGETWL